MNGLLSRVLRCVLSLLLALSVVYLSLSVCVSAAELGDGAGESGVSGESGSSGELDPFDLPDVPVLYANPTDTREDFTMDETIALILGSTVSYSVQYAGFDTPFTGTFKPELLTETDQTYKDYRAFFKFPIPYLGQYQINSIQLIFNFPFEVKNLLSLEFAVAPFYSERFSKNPYNFTYQIDNNLASDGEKVVNSYTANWGFDSTLYSSIDISGNTYYITVLQNNLGCIAAYGKRADTGSLRSAYFGSSDYNERIRIDGNLKDITTFGFTYLPVSGSYSDIGFIFSPMSITYGSGGGYTPPDVVIPDDPIEPDPPDPTDPTDPAKGEYAQQLDDIYKKLVEQGEIQQQQNQAIIDQNTEIINQNQEIINGQQQQIENDNKLQQEQQEHDQQLWDDTFDPSEEDVGGLGDDIFSEDVQNQVKEKLGLFTFIDDTLQKLLDVFNEDGGSTSLRFPGLEVTIDGTKHQVIEPYDFDIQDSLKDFDFLVNAIRFVNGFLIILGFVGYLHRLKGRFFGHD